MSIFYLLAVAPAILVLYYTRVSSIWGVFLVGAIIGYFIEGLVVPVIYMELPISIIWTALSWHPIIDVIFGLWILQYCLREKSFSINCIICSVIGIIWGIWSTWPIGHLSDATGEILTFVPAAEFTAFLFVTTGILFVGNILVSSGADKPFAPTRLDYSIFVITSLCLFILMALQVSVLILIFIIAVSLFYMPLHYANKKCGRDKSIVLHSFEKAPPFPNQLTIWAMPVTASITYWVMSEQNWHVESWILTLPLMILGFALAVISPFKMLRS
ncbi:MAG: hypothetical protein ABW100_13615 [Candidatus Thiodiazotropha sp. 6PLUC3]